MSKQHEFIYDYRDDHNEENNKKLARNAIILLVISILLFLFSHFVVISTIGFWGITDEMTFG